MASVLLATTPALSTVQVLSASSFAPLGFAFPTDGRGHDAVSLDLQYAWKEIRRWQRSYCVICDEAPDEDVLHIFHLLFSALFLKLNAETSDPIDKSVRAALQPLRHWTCTVVRTVQEYEDLMRNVRVSMLELYQTVDKVGLADLNREGIATVTRDMQEVATFLRLKPAAEESTPDTSLAGHKKSGQPPDSGAGKRERGMMARFRKMFRGKRSA